MFQALAELQAEFKIACENVGEAYVNARVARQRLKDALARREHLWSRFTQFQRMEVDKVAAPAHCEPDCGRQEPHKTTACRRSKNAND